jgi:AmmeMemoRadiSam system protein A/AmmeMemoRadiSam system protein B
MKSDKSSPSVIEKKDRRLDDNVSEAGVVCAILMPHAPILVPGVGGERSGAAIASCRAMRTAAQCVMNHHPEAVVLISPHSPRQARAFGFWADDPVQGSFAQFDAPQVAVSLPLDQKLAEAIATEARARDLETWAIHHRDLDHGALVPLWFLAEAGWEGPTVILSLNYPGDDGLVALGGAIAAAAQTLSRRIAIVASGDMSHRLTAKAPCGFHPQAHRFDETFINLIHAGDYRKLGNLASELRELAAEDAVDSTLIAAAAVNWQNTGHQVLNYEGPFGVGYGEAILFADKKLLSAAAPAKNVVDKNDGKILPGLARRSVEAALSNSSEAPPPAVGGYLNTKQGVFVTLFRRDGQLRGCIGTFAPTSPNLVIETWRNARLAALQDNRFSAVTAGELGDLLFSVSVIHSLEDVLSEEELDPQRYGVIVSASDGRRGLLLPGLNDIKTTEEQLRIARKKGWITPDESIMIQRFEVDHFEEPD